ncbi:MAG: acyloxyacyl hydrolase [Bacteroidia bacterium]|jgi:hypothetical protein|nr:acyloxyacyl hydrolase [Bacteroidia bacterium]
MFSTPTIRIIILVICIASFAKKVLAQNTSYTNYQISFGKTIPHFNSAIKSSSVSHQISWGQILKEKSFKSLYKCEVQRGFIVNYTKFGSDKLGQTFTLASFLNPSWTIVNKFDLVALTRLGLSFSTNPFNPINNLENKHYSSITNMYGSLGVELIYSVNQKFSMNGCFQLNHFSNGTFKIPNQGLNWYSGGIGLSYNLGKMPYWLPKDTSRKFKPYFEIGTFIAYPSLKLITSKNYLINGVILQYGIRGLLHGWNFGTEIVHDPLYVARGFGNGVNVSPMLFSIVMGHEFILGKLLFSQQIGVYLHRTNSLYPASFYHRWGLTYPIFKKVSIGLNLKVHSQEANFFDARIVYTLDRRND